MDDQIKRLPDRGRRFRFLEEVELSPIRISPNGR